MCVGLAKTEDMVRAAAAGVGNAVVLMGASTGRDGIGGASVLASAELGEGDEAKRPTVQIGDPFEESKVLECCLELLEKGLLVSLQDLGAAGLTSSAGEMASAGGVGIDIDVARVPLREADMEPFEIMVSESQERMLAVVEPAQGRRGAGGLREMADRLGRDRRRHRQRPGPDPARRRGRRRDAGRGAGRRLPALRPRAGRAGGLDLRQPGDAGAGRLGRGRRCWRCSPPPAIASKRWAFEQYDSVVGSRTVRRPESADAAVLQLPEAGNAIAVSIDGNGRRVACDPYAGTIEAVLECAQNLACVGAEPLGLTNCLNFGNPEKPAPAWQLDRAVSGLADACKALGVPVVGGNVSLYNEGPEGPIYPTPVVGMVGELPDPAAGRRQRLRRARATRSPCSAPSPPPSPARSWPSSAASSTPGLPQPDVAAVAAACATVRDAVRAGKLASAHDVSDGGLACALAESAIGGRARLPGRPAAAARTRLLARGGAVRRGHAAASWSAASAPRWRRSAPILIGEVGGSTIEIAAGDRSLARPGRGRRAWSLASSSGLNLK